MALHKTGSKYLSVVVKRAEFPAAVAILRREPPAKDPDDARVSDPGDKWYRLIKRQLHRNRKRRGRRHYVVTLNRLKQSFFNRPPPAWLTAAPHNHATDFVAPSDKKRFWDWPYVYLMMTFDFLTPSFVIGNLALFLWALIVVVTVTYMYMAGTYINWLLQQGSPVLDDPDPDVADAALFEVGRGGNTSELALWGPEVLERRIGNNTHLPDRLLIEWGALAPAAVAAPGSQGHRYIFSLFVHRSWWHFFILALCTLLAGALMERRYGLIRTFIMALVLGTSGTLLAAATIGSCTVAVGLSPIAWGFLVWWIVDVAAIMSFWVWSDSDKIKQQLSKWRNLSKLLLLVCTHHPFPGPRV